MKIFLYAILLGMEYVLGKIVYLLWVSMISNGLAVVPGVVVVGIFLAFMLSLWRYGSKKIKGE